MKKYLLAQTILCYAYHKEENPVVGTRMQSWYKNYIDNQICSLNTLEMKPPPRPVKKNWPEVKLGPPSLCLFPSSSWVHCLLVPGIFYRFTGKLPKNPGDQKTEVLGTHNEDYM